MPALYRIGVISDTHNRFHPRLPELLQGVDEIWHLGDVCDDHILSQLEVICPRLWVVRGNNDFASEAPLTLDLERKGELFHLVHIPPRKSVPTVGWLLCGHTHVPQNELVGDVHWFNPGSAGLANKGAPLSLGFLTKKGDLPFQASVSLI